MQHLQKPVISIVYHSNNGNTKAVAELLAATISAEGPLIRLLSTEEALRNINLLHESNAIVFGCPTCFGTLSAGFKAFMEATDSFWYRQPWRNKLAAGFTCSSTAGGGKLDTLHALFCFAAQHGMHWVSLGVLPRFCAGSQTDGQNRLACYTGLTVQMDQSIPDGDLLTIELFGRRLCEVTRVPHL
jgi:NAD(P)H dehydrogenase (quinone)